MTLTSYLTRASLLPTSLFLIIPGMLFYFNRSEWGGDLLPLWIGVGAWLLTTGLIAVAYPLLGSKRSLVGHTLFVTGLIILANDLFAPVQLEVLDGQALSSDEPLSQTLLEVAIAVGIAVFFVKTRSWTKPWPGLLAGQLLAVGVLLVGLSALNPGGRGAEEESGASAEASGPNVYQLHLDAMQTGYFRRYLEQDGQASAFDGFVLYENNIANYLFTLPSVASYLTGTLYREGRYDHWIDAATGGLPERLRGQGYRLHFYGKNAILDANAFDSSTFAYELVKEHTQLSHPQVFDFVRLWVARIAPNALTNKGLEVGESLGAYVRDHANRDRIDAEAAPLSVEHGIEPYSGVLLMDKATADEQSRGDRGHYTLVQPLLPHGPYVIEQDCGYRGSRKPTRNGYYEQVVCIGRLVEQFIDQLQQLGRYEDSLILVHGDHGSGWAGLPAPDGEGGYPYASQVRAPGFRNWNPEDVLSRARALLMIKLPGAKGPLRISEYPAQLVDIYPTVMAGLGLPVESGLDGVDLVVAEAEELPRERHFYLFTPGKMRSKAMATYDAIIPEGPVPLALERSETEEKALAGLRCGEMLQFSEGTALSNYTSEGLSGLENWGRWSNGPQVRIGLQFDDDACDARSLVIGVLGYAHEGQPPVVARLSLNGEPIGEMVFDANQPGSKGPRDIVLSLPEGLLLSGEENQLLVEIQGAASPRSLGKSKDIRELGVLFQTLIISQSPGAE